MAMVGKEKRNRRIVSAYKGGDTIIEIGERFNISHQRVCQIAKAAGAEPRGKSSGVNHYRWVGGRWVDSKGYVRVLDKGNPMADAAGYVAEHRLIMSREIGRPLTIDEHVHHVNGVGDDNRPSNLVLMTAGDHMAHHGDERSVGRDVLVAHLARMDARLGHTPRIKDMNADPLSPSHMVYVRRFGSIQGAQRAAGLEPNGVGGAGHITRR